MAKEGYYRSKNYAVFLCHVVLQLSLVSSFIPVVAFQQQKTNSVFYPASNRSYKEFISHVIKIYEWNDIVVISDMEDSVSEVTDILHSYDEISVDLRWAGKDVVRPQLEVLLFGVDGVSKANDFLVMTERPWEVITAADEIFLSEGRGSLLPHRVKFLVVSFDTDLAQVSKMFQSSVFDNICLINVDKTSQTVLSMHTLMWRGQRKREFDYIPPSYVHTAMDTFPNLRYKMNGRKLVCLCKIWTNELTAVENPETGRLEYSGITVDMVSVLSEALNFTCEFTPPPEHDQEMSWIEFSQLLNERQADIGLSLWTQNSVVLLNHTVSFPVMDGGLFGVYSGRFTFNAWESPLLTLYAPEVYPIILCSFVVIACVVGLAMRIVANKAETVNNQARSDGPIQSLMTKHLFQSYTDNNKITKVTSKQVHENQNAVKSNSFEALEIAPRPDTTENSRTFSIKQNSSSIKTGNNLVPVNRYTFVDTIFGILGTFFSQGLLPRPISLSARLVLMTWAFSVLIFVSIYNATLTANLIRAMPYKPITSLTELVENRAFQWCMPRGYASYVQVMQRADNESVLYKLFLGMEYLEQPEPQPCDSIDGIMSRLDSEPNFVALLNPNDLAEYASRFQVKNLARIDETVIPAAKGFVLPKKAELTPFLDEKLQELVASGLMLKVTRNWSVPDSLDDILQTINLRENQQVGTSSDLMYLLWLFFWCAAGVGGAVLALLAECAIARLVKFRFHKKTAFFNVSGN